MDAVVLERKRGTAAGLTLEARADGRLTAVRDGERRVVWVRQSFPWSERSRYLSLRDEDEREFALVADAADLDADSRLALEEALAQAGFVLAVTRVTAIEEEVEVRCWSVVTRQGDRRFQTRLDDWPRALPDGSLLVRDVAGDLYLIGDPAALDRRSRALLWAFVD